MVDPETVVGRSRQEAHRPPRLLEGRHAAPPALGLDHLPGPQIGGHRVGARRDQPELEGSPGAVRRTAVALGDNPVKHGETELVSDEGMAGDIGDEGVATVLVILVGVVDHPVPILHPGRDA